MLKRLFIVLALMLGFAGLTQSQSTAAEMADVKVVLHKRAFPTGDTSGLTHQNTGEELSSNSPLLQATVGLNGVTYDVYDASALLEAALAANQSVSDFVQHYTGMSRSAALAVVAEHDLAAKAQITTTRVGDEDGVAEVTLPTMVGENQAAYYFIEREVANDDMSVDIFQTSPMMIVMGTRNEDGTLMNPLHLYPKNDLYGRDPYFFKYEAGEDADRLAGAQFVFTKIDDEGATRYLAAKQPDAGKVHWVLSDDPGKDDAVAKFASDKDGLVTLAGISIPAGDYRFYEVIAPKGYVLSEIPVNVTIPAGYFDEDGKELLVEVNGHAIPNTVGGAVTPGAVNDGVPAVYNYPKDPGDPEEPGNPGEPEEPGEPDEPGNPDQPGEPDEETDTEGDEIENPGTPTRPGGGSSTPGSSTPGGGTTGGWISGGGGLLGGLLPQLGNKAAAVIAGIGVVLLALVGIVWVRKQRHH